MRRGGACQNGAVKLSLLATFLFLCTPAAAHEHGQQWTLASQFSAASAPGQDDEVFARLVADVTEGHVSVVAMPDGKLGYKPREQLDAVAKGHAEMAHTSAAALGEAEPVFNRASIPSPVSDATKARALYEAARPSYESAFARHNQKLLYSTPLPPSGNAIPLSFTTVNLVRWKGLDKATRASIEKAAAATEARQWKSLGLTGRQ